MMPDAPLSPEKPIIFFDGVCNLCNSFVNFLITRDSAKQFHYSSLQGTTAISYLPKAMIDTLESVVLIDEKGRHTRSTAAIRILSRLGGFWKLTIVLLIIPKFFRDPVYIMIAQNRYKIWGKKESCRLPSKEEAALFLP